jgi:hypothetical protein
MRGFHSHKIELFVLLWLGISLTARAQWLTQSIVIKPGWSAIYLHVDASYESLNALVGADAANPIVEIWRWQAPATTVQYITSPEAPLTTSSDWARWKRDDSSAAVTLGTLTPNTAYLVHSAATTNFVWRVKGRPAVPNYTWTTTGLNFLGFPTSPANAPPLDLFLSPAPEFSGAAQIYRYPGGELGPDNPALVFAPHAVPVRRGEAFWIRSGSVFNDYFGPFEVSLGSSDGINFGGIGSEYGFHLRNPSSTNVTVTLNLLPSENPPAGQPGIAGTPPILVRGALNDTNLTYGYTDLTRTAAHWTLPPKGQPGSDITVVLGVNRSALADTEGALYAGILRFTDSLGYEQVDAAVSAESASSAGLWVGQAQVSQVASYLKSYQRDAGGKPVMNADGSYAVTNVNTRLGPVAQAFPLRLILHDNGTNVVLLQRVYYGQDVDSNLVVATGQSALDPAHLDAARRISSVTLPWSSANVPWPFAGGRLASGNTLTTTVNLAYDDQASNPFLHTYHPDHDNLDATFQNELPRGAESYDITRTITLTIDPENDDFTSLTRAGQAFSGQYSENLTLLGTGSASRTFHVSGHFSINRISPVARLTQP